MGLLKWCTRDRSEGNRILVIGIDFGTTFSGVAWGTKDDFENRKINTITNCPGTGREEGKVPTELYYECSQVKWGFELPTDADTVRWFKLLLLKDEDLSEEMRCNEFILRSREMLKETGGTAVDLIADYLSALWMHTMACINKARGESVVETFVFQVVITVPATWKGYARQEIEEAARKAGILDGRVAGPTELTLVPEPEAAALSTFSEPGRKVKAKEVYIVCDAGGGTVDLTTYKIRSVGPMTLEEAVEGTGGLCGGTSTDQAFERMCRARLGYKWDCLSTAGIKEIMKGEWGQSIKPQFTPGYLTKEYIIGIPAEAFDSTYALEKWSLDDLDRGPFIKNGRIHFKSADIQGLFTDSFAEIDDLIDEEIQKSKKCDLKIDGIILVGGLGASPYLYEHLKQKHANKGIRILQSRGMRPRTAVCHGAVIKGFVDQMNAKPSSIKVTSTMSRLSFGIKHLARFDENIHLEEDKDWCDYTCKFIARDRMQWYLRRGVSTSMKKRVRYKWSQYYRSDPGKWFSTSLWQCSDDVPPSRFESSVTRLCIVGCEIDVPFSKFKNYTNPCGEKLKRLDYEIEMVPSGATVEFAVYIQGRKQGAQNVQIVFQ